MNFRARFAEPQFYREPGPQSKVIHSPESGFRHAGEARFVVEAIDESWLFRV
jgi:hypothetical protein